MVDLLTGSPQEELFFRTSAMIEIRGWEALDAMANCIVDSQSLRCSSEWGPGIDAEAPASNLAFHLERLGKTLDDMTWILKDIRRGLDPDFFYNKFRPWIQGADQGADSPSWLYESVDGTGLLLQPSGPSAGQSALMQSFDAFLDVLHPHSKLNLGGGCTRFNASLDPNNLTLGPLPEGHPSLSGSLSQKSSVSLTPLTPPETPAYSPAVDAFNVSRLLVSLPTQPEGAITSGPKSAVDTSFNARMRSYMTQGQQDFLSWLREHSIRPFIESLHFSDSSPSTDYLSTCQKATIIQAYDACLMALKRWRDAHILIVTEYVIIPARKPTSILSHIPSWKSGDVEEPKAVRGTGGTSLIPLLKIYRDNTLRALLSPLRLY
ncbi:Indoleamine 2,3-dioxygenase [Cantharellus anzutake]|uniref:Indoleamine 2,3-dioxygenase n=1 Tax=Cantharellus anzutake TaxID=1750568 RepID=UPI0019068648|nr:Indoleamine 2,3-dioxygenase [Cantharellus anzutake]KAF8340476.1 Indoleamine 2,3-dioxygenase [Cantharellus anzutake]